MVLLPVAIRMVSLEYQIIVRRVYEKDIRNPEVILK